MGVIQQLRRALGRPGEGDRVRAVWNGATLAESDGTVVVEGNHYFPPDSVNRRYFERSQRRTTCPWKGVARYHTVVVDGERNEAAAWYYPEPSPAAARIRDHVAFWHGVKVVAVDEERSAA